MDCCSSCDFILCEYRHFDEKTNRWRWQCANIEVQKNVLRSIGAFLDSLSGDARAARNAVVKVYILLPFLFGILSLVSSTYGPDLGLSK